MKRHHLKLFAVTLFTLGFSTGAHAASGDPEAVYRAFLEVRGHAETLDDVAPFLPAAALEQMQSAPPEMQKQIMASVTNPELAPPDGGFEVVAQSGDDTGVELTLRGEAVTNGVREFFQSTVSMVREEDGWKIQRPRDWRTVGLLPAELDADTTPRPIGPGAAPGEFSVGDYELIAEIEGNGEGESRVLFDPRGQFVMLTKQNTVRQLSLDGLEEIWAADVYQAYLPAPTLSADGSALLVLGQGYEPAVVPLSPNETGTPAGLGYYYYHPVFPQALGLVEGGLRFEGFAYHPKEPIVALSLIGYPDTSKGYVLLQPAGKGLWAEEELAAGETWETEPMSPVVAWSPTGEHLALLFGLREPGGEIRVRSWPAGEEATTLSRPDFGPVDIVFDAEGRLLAASGFTDAGALVIVWDLETGEQIAELAGLGSKVAFAPGGEHLLAVRARPLASDGSGQDEILVWKIGDPEPESVITAFPQADATFPYSITALGVSPNGRFLLAVSDSGAVRLWDAKND